MHIENSTDLHQTLKDLYNELRSKEVENITLKKNTSTHANYNISVMPEK